MANVVNSELLSVDDARPKKHEAKPAKKFGSVNITFTNLHHQPLQLFNYVIPVGGELKLIRPVGLAISQTPDAKNLVGLKWLKIEM